MKNCTHYHEKEFYHEKLECHVQFSCLWILKAIVKIKKYIIPSISEKVKRDERECNSRSTSGPSTERNRHEFLEVKTGCEACETLKYITVSAITANTQQGSTSLEGTMIYNTIGSPE